MTSVSATRYAEALADVVFSPGAALKAEDAFRQLSAFEALLHQHSNLRHVLNTPAVPSARKRAVVDDLAKPLGLAPLMRNFVFVLIDHHRIAQIAEVREAFGHAIDQRMGFVRADVVSAQPLDKDQSEELEQELSRVAGKRVWANFKVDAELIGGVVARMGSRTYDGSVRGQLDKMRQKLTARS